MEQQTSLQGNARASRIRWLIVTMLFAASCVNYADRSALSAASKGLGKKFFIDAESLGYIIAAWGWSYVLGQIPSGRLLDRFGSRRVYGISILLWSVLIFMCGFASFLPDAGMVFLALIVLNYLIGLAEAPAFPGNGRLVANWFPASERGTASSIFNSSQYFATVMFVPLMGYLAQTFSWPWVFWAMGAMGLVLTGLWFRMVHGPREHPWVNEGELEYISKGGALVDIGARKSAAKKGWFYTRQLLTSRMLVGVYLGQYCITTLTYFFVQWIVPYLVDHRRMSLLKAGFVAALPALFGFSGSVLGGIVSDFLMRRGFSLTFARKAVIIGGMMVASTIVLCNYVASDWVVVGILCFAFFGKGFGAIGWTVVSDTAPKEVIGLCGGIFNMVGNSAQITLAYVVVWLIRDKGNFNAVVAFVAAHAVLAIVAYAVIVGPIKRMELKEKPVEGARVE